MEVKFKEQRKSVSHLKKSLKLNHFKVVLGRHNKRIANYCKRIKYTIAVLL